MLRKLMWEFSFMLDHYVGEFCNSPLESLARKELSEAFHSSLRIACSRETLFYTQRLPFA